MSGDFPLLAYSGRPAFFPRSRPYALCGCPMTPFLSTPAARRQHKLVSRFDRADVKRRAFFWYLDFRSRPGEYSLLSDHTAPWLDDYLRWHLDALGGLGGVW